MSSESSSETPAVIEYLLDEEYVLGTLIYVIICIPLYFWFEGPMGNAGTVYPSVVIFAMVSGSLLLVPMVAKILRTQFGVGVPDNLERIKGGAFKDSLGTLSQEEN